MSTVSPNGSNTTTNNIESFKQWPLALDEIVSIFTNVILIGHSTGGMYALSLPSLEDKLLGLILIDSAPDASWQINLEKMIKSSPIPELERLDKIYRNSPNNEVLKALTVAAAPYFFIEKSLQKGIALLQSLPYNYEICNWSEKYFDSSYKALWVP